MSEGCGSGGGGGRTRPALPDTRDNAALKPHFYQRHFWLLYVNREFCQLGSNWLQISLDQLKVTYLDGDQHKSWVRNMDGSFKLLFDDLASVEPQYYSAAHAGVATLVTYHDILGLLSPQIWIFVGSVSTSDSRSGGLLHLVNKGCKYPTINYWSPSRRHLGSLPSSDYNSLVSTSLNSPCSVLSKTQKILRSFACLTMLLSANDSYSDFNHHQALWIVIAIKDSEKSFYWRMFISCLRSLNYGVDNFALIYDKFSKILSCLKDSIDMKKKYIIFILISS